MKTNSFVNIYRSIIKSPKTTQRNLSANNNISLGSVNNIIKNGVANKEIKIKDNNYFLTDRGLKKLDEYKVDNAIILSAGFGSRYVPLTYETPKGLLKVNGKPMLERQIEQLKDEEINNIIIVVGYMKEKFDYLIDKYNVKLIYNPEYAVKNNLASLYLVSDYLKNTYVLVSDNHIEKSIFNKYEPESWYSTLYFKERTDEWCVNLTKSNKIESIKIGGDNSYAIVGPSYFSKSFSKKYKKLLKKYYNKPGTNDYYWEHILKQNINTLDIYANIQTSNVYEFENMEELRDYDKSYEIETNNKIMEFISDKMNIPQKKIKNIFPLKEGLTNNSFHFSINGNNYVFRVPGAGTDKLINRRNEKRVYELIKPLEISDDVVFFDAETGVKITKYYKNTRNSDPFNDLELKECMKQIRKIHNMKIKIDHSFNIENMINYYYSLAKGKDAILFSDIDETKKKLDCLIKVKNSLNIEEILCHGDYAHVNVLMLEDGTSKVIDWEYSGMGDPIMDISMYSIFAEFDRERMDYAFKLYLKRDPNKNEKLRLYLYVALSGFLWCMWSQYKQSLGQEFGEYPLKMYRYMKEFYNILKDENYI